MLYFNFQTYHQSTCYKLFFNDSIFSSTKTIQRRTAPFFSFMMTQFFQVLKPASGLESSLSCFMMTQFFQVLKPPVIDKRTGKGFMMTQFFQVLKRNLPGVSRESSFMMTQFFQVLKLRVKNEYEDIQFYDDSILSGTKTDHTALIAP